MKERLQKMLGERTLVLIKPDAVMRGLIGVICQRFEQAGLKIAACRMVFPTRKLLDGHFPKSEDWIRGMGEKTLETYREYQIDPVEILGTADALTIGQKIKKWNYRYLTLGPVMALVLEGIHAVNTVRKLIGHTLPYKAASGTIRGDFSINAPDLANVVGSACKNLVHASGTLEEAEQEIANWFNPTELVTWQRTDDFMHFVLGEFIENHAKQGDIMQYAALEQTLDSLREVDPRNAAEYAYVIAMLHKRTGDSKQAIQFGRESIALFGKCRMDTMEECAARNVVIEGVALPDLIHQDVVRDRLQPLKL
ncbi:MAG: nucleoside-diphosphate kinase [Thermodesulfobacteriota bacterium]